MGVFDIFSKRQRRLLGELPDVYQYDQIPQELRVQIVYILRDTLGNERDCLDGRGEVLGAYRFIVETLCREYGVFKLDEQPYGGKRSFIGELVNFLLQEPRAGKVLDAVELSFRGIDRLTRGPEYLWRQDASERADNAIQELNARFREHGVGYEYQDGEILRIDSALVHAEVVKPALALLRGGQYQGAQQEFLSAHEHYRHGRAKEALVDCLKALESVMKTICSKRGWKHDGNAPAKALIDLLVNKGLIPAFWNSHFSALRSTLEAGVPTARNKLGGHGQGSQIVQVPDHIVAYVIHLTAAAIVFLEAAEKELP
jgi:hypothetical protein